MPSREKRKENEVEILQKKYINDNANRNKRKSKNKINFPGKKENFTTHTQFLDESFLFAKKSVPFLLFYIFAVFFSLSHPPILAVIVVVAF